MPRLSKSAYPTALETVLRAKETVGACLEAGRALQGTRVV